MYACSFAVLYLTSPYVMTQNQLDGSEVSSNCNPFVGLFALAGQLPISQSYNM